MLAIIAAASIVFSSHVRSTDPMIGAALTEGLLQSEVIRRLVDVIDASDVIVYLARGDCPRPAVACLMISQPWTRCPTRSDQLPAADRAREARRLAQGRSVSRDCSRTAACRRNRRVAGGRRRRDDAGRLYPPRSRSGGSHFWIQTPRSKPVTTAARNCSVAVVDDPGLATAKSSRGRARGRHARLVSTC